MPTRPYHRRYILFNYTWQYATGLSVGRMDGFHTYCQFSGWWTAFTLSGSINIFMLISHERYKKVRKQTFEGLGIVKKATITTDSSVIPPTNHTPLTRLWIRCMR